MQKKISGEKRVRIIQQQRMLLRTNFISNGALYSDGDEFEKIAEDFVVDLYGKDCCPELRFDAMKLFFGYDEELKDGFRNGIIRKMQETMLDNELRDLVLCGIRRCLNVSDLFMANSITSEEIVNKIKDRFNQLFCFYRGHLDFICQLPLFVYFPDVYGGEKRLELQMKYIGIPFNFEFVDNISMLVSNNKNSKAKATDYDECFNINLANKTLQDSPNWYSAFTLSFSHPLSKKEVGLLIKQAPSEDFNRITGSEYSKIIDDFGPKIQVGIMQKNKVNSLKIFEFLKTQYGIRQYDNGIDSSYRYNLLQKYSHAKASKKII